MSSSPRLIPPAVAAAAAAAIIEVLHNKFPVYFSECFTRIFPEISHGRIFPKISHGQISLKTTAPEGRSSSSRCRLLRLSDRLRFHWNTGTYRLSSNKTDSDNLKNAIIPGGLRGFCHFRYFCLGVLRQVVDHLLCEVLVTEVLHDPDIQSGALSGKVRG